MFRKFSIWPLFIACFLVIGHAVFPHTHQQDASEDTLIAELNLPLEEGFFTFLNQLFSQDLGDNHLEEFNQESEDIAVPVYLAQAFLFTLLYLDCDPGVDEQASGFSLYFPDLHSSVILKDAPLRAPPQA
jgi:hypothetical protein